MLVGESLWPKEGALVLSAGGSGLPATFGLQGCTVPDLCAKVARTFSQQDQAARGARLFVDVQPHLFI
jgi:hypothetical protein